jgi:plastocyanin
MRASSSLGPILALACAATFSACQAPGTTAPSAIAAPVARGVLADEEPAPPPPAPDPPLVNTVTISVVATAGTQSFDPNPGTAAVGDTIVWTNNDQLLHHIVFDDGTDVGDIAPGASSVAVPLMTPTATYHCTIHPSMVGSINQELAPPPPEQPEPDPYSPPGYYYSRPVRR